MFVIVGLGNPGSHYERTRHNIGFRVVDAIADQENVDVRKARGLYLEGLKRIRDTEILLVKPLTYMNNSGDAILDIVSRYGTEIGNILVVVDDFHIPLGTVRFRRSGSAGGHNGLVSIIERLQSKEFPRLRCGIGSELMPADKSELADFVLSPFARTERGTVKSMVDRARDVALTLAVEGFDAAMRLL